MKVILTGGSGFVGEGVLLECLAHPTVEQVLAVSRRPLSLQHSKLKQLVVDDFLHIADHARELSGYDACFFCSGISAVGKSEAEYTRVTYDTTLAFANALLQQSPGTIFEYVSGQMTDSSEHGRMMWARVKGRTENALLRLPFRHVYCIRPGLMRPTKGQHNATFSARLLGTLYPVIRLILPNKVSTMRQVGLAMIRCAQQEPPERILEVKDINALAK